MSPNYLLSELFKLKLHQADGEGFQGLFNDLMAYAHAGYEPVLPWGNHGDRGNDGYIPSERHFYQLYAPSNLSHSISPVAACSKARKDFAKLTSSYPEVLGYQFVLNDKFKGIPAPVTLDLEFLRKERPLLTNCGAIGCHRLLAMFNGLPVEKRELIVGSVPAVNPVGIDLSALGALLKVLADGSDDLVIGGITPPPEFDAKALFNGLSSEAQELLRNYARRTNLVGQLINARDAWWQQAIADDVHDRYVSVSATLPPDTRLMELVDRLIPKVALSNVHSKKAYREAALLVVAKYFETCDVFENPVSAPSAKARDV